VTFSECCGQATFQASYGVSNEGVLWFRPCFVRDEYEGYRVNIDHDQSDAIDGVVLTYNITLKEQALQRKGVRFGKHHTCCTEEMK
jgi:hypothetical protein